MKQVVNVSIGSRSFVLESDAYDYLKGYLLEYKTYGGEKNEKTMADLEIRIAEILSNQISGVRNVVTLSMVVDVADQIGMPNGESYNAQTPFNQSYAYMGPNGVNKKLYRDADNSSIAGVCGGLGIYFNVEPLLFKVIFLFLFFVVGGGLLLYIILWILLPKATTPAQKCELRGLPKTAENLSKFTS